MVEGWTESLEDCDFQESFKYEEGRLGSEDCNLINLKRLNEVKEKEIQHPRNILARNVNLSDEIMIVLKACCGKRKSKDNTGKTFFIIKMFFIRCLKYLRQGGKASSPIKNYQHHIDDVLFEFNFVGWLVCRKIALAKLSQSKLLASKRNEKFSCVPKFVDRKSASRSENIHQTERCVASKINLFIQTFGSLWIQWAETAIGIINKREIIRFWFGVCFFHFIDAAQQMNFLLSCDIDSQFVARFDETHESKNKIYVIWLKPNLARVIMFSSFYKSNKRCWWCLLWCFLPNAPESIKFPTKIVMGSILISFAFDKIIFHFFCLCRY